MCAFEAGYGLQPRVRHLCPDMEAQMVTDASDLIARLCTVAGTIMEDVSPIALTRPGHPSTVETTLRELQRAAQDIVALANAVEVVGRRR
jgi:hypothetical protein